MHIQTKASALITRHTITQQKKNTTPAMVLPAVPAENILFRGKSIDDEENENMVQGKFIIQLQKNKQAVQLRSKQEDELQLKTEDITVPFSPLQKKENKTGLPDNLKTDIENLSGFSMDDVNVHYNSDKPVQLNALAFAQGTDIHVAPSQEKHLPHEAWHVVRQKQGRGKATMQMKTGIAINDDPSLEYEADVMGVKAVGSDPRISTEAIQHYSTNRSLLQLRKTTKPSDVEDQRTLITDIGLKVKQNVLKGKVGAQEKTNAIWAEATSVYEANEAKGAGYESELAALIAQYKDTAVKEGETESPRHKVVNDKTALRADYDRKFAANYANAPVKTLSTGLYRINTKGYDPSAGEPPKVKKGAYKGNYSNEANLAAGSIKATSNLAAEIKKSDWSIKKYKDKALAAGKGLPNSEILWQQYKLAAEEKHQNAIDKNAPVLAELKRISKIQRDKIINNETLVTGYMAYNDGERWDTNRDWDPGTSGFRALLGTPNGKSSFFFLKDHLDQLEKTFHKITSTSSQGLDIIFKPI